MQSMQRLLITVTALSVRGGPSDLHRHKDVFIRMVPGCSRSKGIGNDIHLEQRVTFFLYFNYGMLEMADSILRPVLQVGDRHFTVCNASMEITDQVAHYKFFLEFTKVFALRMNFIDISGNPILPPPITLFLFLPSPESVYPLSGSRYP